MTADQPAPAAPRLPPAGTERTEAVRALRRDVAENGLTRSHGAWALLRGAALVLPYAAACALAVQVGTWWAWALQIVVSTTVLCTLPALYHEATHRSVSRHRLLNDAIGTVAAALHFVPFASWRYFHLTHHAHTGTDGDSEVYGRYWSRWTLLAFPATQWAFAFLLWRWTLASMRGKGPRWISGARQRTAIRRNTAAVWALWAVEAAACAADPRVLALVVAPSALSLMIAALTLVPEHFPAYRIGPGDADQLDRTNSFASNPLLRLLLWNSNFHAAHHFAPKVPAHHLRRLDDLISTVQEPAWRWPGYYRWYRDRLGGLSWTPVDLSAGHTAESFEER